MNCASYNTSCNGYMRWDGDGDGAGGEDDVDDDLDDACDDGDDDGDDLPFREMFSLAESARRRCLFFSICFRHGAAAGLPNSSPFRFFYDREYIGLGSLGIWWPPLAPLRPIFVILQKNAPR